MMYYDELSGESGRGGLWVCTPPSRPILNIMIYNVWHYSSLVPYIVYHNVDAAEIFVIQWKIILILHL